MKHDRWSVLALIGVLCLLSFVRAVYGLGDRSLWWDESLSHYRATMPFSFILTNRIDIKSAREDIPTIDNHPPLYFVLLRCMVLAAGDSEFALRFLSVLAGVLLIPLLYQCGCRLAGRTGGVFAALLGTFSPLYLWYQQEARPYMLVTWLGLFSFYALSRLPTAWTQKRSAWMWSAGYVLAVAAVLLTHYHSIFLLAAQMIGVGGWALSRQTAHHRWMWPAIFAVAGLIAVPVCWWALRDVPLKAEFPGYTFIPLHTLLLDVFRSFSLGPSGSSMPGSEWLGIALFAAAAIMVLIRRRALPFDLVMAALACFLVPVALIFAVSFVRPVYMNIRHLIFASPFFYLFLALGAAQGWSTRRKIWAMVNIGALVVAMLASTWFYWTDPHHTKEDHRGWGEYLRRHVRPNDLVIIHPGLIADLYFYYASNPADWIGLPVFGGAPQDTIQYLEQAVHTYDRIWVAESLTPHWATQGGLVPNWLDQHARRTALVSFDSATTLVRVWAFRSTVPTVDALPSVWTQPRLNFDGRISLLGVDANTTRIQAGQTLQLSFYWSATQPPERDYRITLTLSDADGFSWAGTDYAPCDGVCPTWQWTPGQIVRDDIDLDLPPGIPPGRYQIRLSVYPADRSGPSLAAYGLDDGTLKGLIATVGEIEIAAGRKTRPTISAARALPVEATPVRWRDSGLRLLGYRYDTPDHLPGDMMALHLYWCADHALHAGRSFVIQLVDQKGTTIAERVYPLSVRYPPNTWAGGALVWEQYRFRIPAATAAGEYRLYIAADQSSRRRVALGRLNIAQSKEQREFAVPPMQYALGLNLGNQIELMGYDLESNTVQPGGVVSCTLYWRALQEIELDYTVFTHLVAADGQVWGRWDSRPQGGAMPTTRWVPGQVIADPRRVPVDPNAPIVQVQPLVGLYDSLTMQRLSVYDDQGQIIADHVVLTKIDIQDR